jgi:hypothetical protein
MTEVFVWPTIHDTRASILESKAIPVIADLNTVPNQFRTCWMFSYFCRILITIVLSALTIGATKFLLNTIDHPLFFVIGFSLHLVFIVFIGRALDRGLVKVFKL